MLLHGASGGVGTAMLQLAKLAGGAGDRGGPGTGRHPHRLQDRGLRVGDSSPYW